jgi:hypothetical protein
MSTLIDNLAQDRHAARYQTAPRRPLATTARRAAASPLASTRSRAGWLLVGLGLRLVMRGGDTPARRASLLGQ